MKELWWLEIVGFFLAVTGGWRLLWRFPVILGLLGANKLGTANGDQAEVNKQNVAEMKKGIPLAILFLVVGIILILVF